MFRGRSACLERHMSLLPVRLSRSLAMWLLTHHRMELHSNTEGRWHANTGKLKAAQRQLLPTVRSQGLA